MRAPDIDALVRADERLGAAARMLFVRPFYLELMGTNAVRAPEPLLASAGRRSRLVTDNQVLLMLRGTWRHLVMGSWYAIARDDDTLSKPVHDALETCLGHLTSPALITAMLFYPRERTLPLLLDYAAADRANGWGMADLAGAAARRLGGETSPRDEAGTDERVALLDALWQRGAQLRRLHARRR